MNGRGKFLKEISTRLTDGSVGLSQTGQSQPSVMVSN